MKNQKEDVEKQNSARLERNTSVQAWICSSFLALALPIAIPIVSFGLVYNIWSKNKKPVDRRKCTCPCWDTVFKGNYEMGIAGYKHIYFNSTYNTMMIWILTVVCLVAFYECLRSVFVTIWKRQARPKMVILFLLSIYPHYYAWWMYFNYYNDDYYKQWWHQMFFTVTELISTVTVIHLINKGNSENLPKKLLIIISIAVLHVLASGWDQFVLNVIQMQGQLHQVMRDIGFMIPDLLHILLPFLELRAVGKRKALPMSQLLTTNDLGFAALSVFFLWTVSANIP